MVICSSFRKLEGVFFMAVSDLESVSCDRFHAFWRDWSWDNIWRKVRPWKDITRILFQAESLTVDGGHSDMSHMWQSFVVNTFYLVTYAALRTVAEVLVLVEILLHTSDRLIFTVFLCLLYISVVAAQFLLIISYRNLQAFMTYDMNTIPVEAKSGQVISLLNLHRNGPQFLEGRHWLLV